MLARIRYFLAVVMLISGLSTSGPAQAAPVVETGVGGAQSGPLALLTVTWYDGLYTNSTITNCPSIIQGFPYEEKGINAYTGFSADPVAGLPAIGQVFYAHVVIHGMGNACSGQRAFIDIQPPANTSIVISTTNPVKCYAGGAPVSPASDCPQTLPASPYHSGAYAIYSTDTAHALTWPVPQGAIWEFLIPMVSSTALTNSPMIANVLAMDGNGNPWLRPEVGVYVFSNTPTVLYPTPSTTITAGPPAYYKSLAYLYTFGLGGTAYFDMGTTNTYGLVTDAAPVSAGRTAWDVWDDWKPTPSTDFPFIPNTIYHWRLRFAASNGQMYYGLDQTFKTLPNGQATLGTGSAATCTSGALQTALSTPGLKELIFDCGAAPLTIAMSGTKMVSGALTIDGGNRVTLSGGNAFRHFDVQSGGSLTLNNLTLTNGSVNGCGGSIHIQGGGRIDAANLHLTNNHAEGNGGAVCIDPNGQASFIRMQITGNSASMDGGGLYNQGTTEFWWTDISDNHAQQNGGGIWNNHYVDIFSSLLAFNTLPTGGTLDGTKTGGGLYNIGTANVSTSTVANNTSSIAGGIYNLNATIYLTGVTIVDNTALLAAKPLINAAQSGGLQSDGTGSSQVRNTVIARNSPGNCGQSPSHTVVTMGHNLDSANQCKFTNLSDLINTNPRMGSLSFAGGRSRTVPLYGGSPAIDAADNVYCGMYDQRGFSGPGTPGDASSRQVDGNWDGAAICDIGAYEYRPTIFLPLTIR